MGNLAATDWLAVAAVALPLVAKVLLEWSASADQKHNNALARITGMAGREAAIIATTLAANPTKPNLAAIQNELISGAATEILNAMGESSARVGADAGKIQTIVKGELAKLTIKS